jgi:hypothetical protein
MKVVCVKECSYSFNHLDYYFNIGDQFELSKIQPGITFFDTQKIWNSPKNKISIVINFIDGKDYTVTVLQEDFISLPEWRNKQLNLILDENNMYK